MIILYIPSLSRFFDEYKKHNVEFWALTTQNEPLDGEIPGILHVISSGNFTN